jgi:hypothetical protein
MRAMTTKTRARTSSTRTLVPVARDYFFFSALPQPAIACCLAAPSGSGDALTISSHTSRAAARVASGSPLAALSQIASILPLVPLDSVGIALAPRLHDATADATAGDFTEPVVAVVVVPEELDVLLPVLGVELLLELVELLLELPQPASNAAAASGTNSQVESMRIV